MSVEIGFQGAINTLSSDEYHATSAIGSTDIKAAKQSLAHFKSQVSGKKEYSKSTREAFDLGSAAHEIILEKSADRFIRGPDVSSKAVKEWKSFVEANPDKIVLTASEHTRVISMFTAFHAHPIAPKLLSPCQVEQSFFSTDHNTGLWVKARPDAVCADYIVDYKTTSKAALPREFANTCAQLSYDISAAHYMSVIQQVTQKRPKEFYWIVQEVTAPYQLMVYRATSNLLTGAQMRRDELLDQIEKAVKSNFFPGYDTGIHDLDLPSWAIEQQAMESIA